ncbi:RNA polymerase sigma factor [candidate division KSB1 bacterium]
MQNILDGDREEFRILIRRYRRLVSNIVFRMISNPEDREEIGQQIFVRIYRNLPGFGFRSRLSTWIAKIAYNSCLKYLRKKKVPLYDDILQEHGAEKDFGDLTGSRIDYVKSRVLSPDTDMENREIHTFVLQEIENLPLQYRTVITFYHLENMSMQEISEIIEIPLGTVKSHIFRARKIMKDRLLEKYKREELCLENI